MSLYEKTMIDFNCRKWIPKGNWTQVADISRYWTWVPCSVCVNTISVYYEWVCSFFWEKGNSWVEFMFGDQMFGNSSPHRTCSVAHCLGFREELSIHRRVFFTLTAVYVCVLPSEMFLFGSVFLSACVRVCEYVCVCVSMFTKIDCTL